MLSKCLHERGLSVSVLTRKMKGLPSFEIIRGVPVYRSIRTLPWGKWFGITYILSVFWFLYRQRNSYDIIHCHILQGFHSAVAMLFKLFFKKKVIIKVAASGPLSAFKMLKNVLFGKFLLKKIKYADRIIAVCSQSKQEALQEGFPPSSVIQIPNGVDTRLFIPAPYNKANTGKIIFVGRLDFMKGVHVLLKAFRKLKEEGLQAHLDIFGDGPERDKLIRMAGDLSVNDSVSFCGEVKEVVRCLQESTIFVLPSLSEGLSNVILEAMSCGLSVVATRAGGTTDIIKDGVNGLLVDPENSDQLFDAMKKLLNNHDLAEKLGAEARRTAESRFSINTTVDAYVTLYHELCDENSAQESR